MVLYELIVGQVPFASGTPHVVIHDQIYRELPTPTELNPKVPKPIEIVLVRALDKAPEKRYGSANELVDALRDSQIQEADSYDGLANPVTVSFAGTPSSLTRPAKTPGKSRRWIVFGCLALTILAVVFTLIFFRQMRILREQRENAVQTAESGAQVMPIETFIYNIPALTLNDASANLRANQQDEQAHLQLAEAQYGEGDRTAAAGTLLNGAEYADDLLRYSLTAASLALAHGDLNTAYVYSALATEEAEGTDLTASIRAWVGEQLYFAASGELPNLVLLRRTANERGIPFTSLLEALAANSLLAHNRLPAAIAAIDAALAENPSLAEVLLINGEVLAARGNDGAAQQSWQLAQEQPDAPDWVRERVRTLLTTGTT